METKSLMKFDSQDYRTALGGYATGVAVVSVLDETGLPRGVTVNSFNSVSLEPPLVSFCIDKSAFSFSSFHKSKHFVVNVLSETQKAVSVRFARPHPDKWEGIDYDVWESGAPVLSGCLVNLECLLEASHEAGDHVILIGRVTRLAMGPAGSRPLLYFRGAYSRTAD
jgi:flavin reductase (DIM6/NTAB) family NADH-FMN oxidoreductase RutF